jgi:hypothetical protein
MKTSAWTPPPSSEPEPAPQGPGGYPVDLPCIMFINGTEMLPTSLAACLLQGLYQVRVKGQFRIVVADSGDHLLSLLGNEVSGQASLVEVFLEQNRMSAAIFEAVYADVERRMAAKQQSSKND